jgi:valyl-tRNA synthetase
LPAQKIYDFIWDTYCDWYIELTKIRLYGDDEAAKENAQRVLLYVLTDILKLLHPFMPYITEEIWQACPTRAKNGLRITEKKLANEKFVANAPEAVVNVEREKIEKYRELISKLDESMKALKG